VEAPAEETAPVQETTTVTENQKNTPATQRREAGIDPVRSSNMPFDLSEGKADYRLYLSFINNFVKTSNGVDKTDIIDYTCISSERVVAEAKP